MTHTEDYTASVNEIATATGVDRDRLARFGALFMKNIHEPSAERDAAIDDLYSHLFGGSSDQVKNLVNRFMAQVEEIGTIRRDDR